MLEVVVERARRRTHDGHHAFLVALAHHAQHLLVEHDAAKVQPAELGDAQAAAVEHLEDRVVSLTGGRLGKGLVEEGRRLLAADDVRQARGLLGKRQVGRGVRRGDALGDHEAVKSLDGGDGALDARDGEPARAKAAHMALDAVARHLVGQRDALVPEPEDVASQVAPIGKHGVSRAPTLDRDVVEVLLERSRKIHR